MMHSPPHPGEFIRATYLDPFDLSIRSLAQNLGVSPSTLGRVISGRSGISPEMAIRLSIAFDTSPESWLNQQSQYDLWQAEQNRGSLKVRRLSAA